MRQRRKEKGKEGEKEERKGRDEGKKKGRKAGRQEGHPWSQHSGITSRNIWLYIVPDFFHHTDKSISKSAALIEWSGSRTKTALGIIHILMQLKKLKPKSWVTKVTWQVSDWAPVFCPMTTAPPFTVHCLALAKILTYLLSFKWKF